MQNDILDDDVKKNIEKETEEALERLKRKKGKLKINIKGDVYINNANRMEIEYLKKLIEDKDKEINRLRQLLKEKG